MFREYAKPSREHQQHTRTKLYCLGARPAVKHASSPSLSPPHSCYPTSIVLPYSHSAEVDVVEACVELLRTWKTLRLLGGRNQHSSRRQSQPNQPVLAH